MPWTPQIQTHRLKVYYANLKCSFRLNAIFIIYSWCWIYWGLIYVLLRFIYNWVQQIFTDTKTQFFERKCKSFFWAIFQQLFLFYHKQNHKTENIWKYRHLVYNRKRRISAYKTNISEEFNSFCFINFKPVHNIGCPCFCWNICNNLTNRDFQTFLPTVPITKSVPHCTTFGFK